MSIAEKLTIIAENQRDVYNAGFAAGQAQGGGGDDGYDTFWDWYQQHGNRTDYSIYECSFSGSLWTDEKFKPKYDIKPTTAQMMFRKTSITDLREETVGVSFDFSNCNEFGYFCAYVGNNLKYLPEMNISKATNLTSTFDGYGGTDLSLIVSENTKFRNDTFNTKYLENLAISGTIGVSLNLKSTAVLSNASVQNIIDCLKDLTGATAQTLTLHKTVVTNMTQAQKDVISAKNWTLVSG